MSRWTDTFLLAALRFAAAASAAIVLLIIVFLAIESAPVLSRVGPMRFFTDASWNPVEEQYNLTPMLWGTLLASAGAVPVAAVLGVASAVFCRFHAPRPIAAAYRRLIELLAGIPSVVYGLWGLTTLVPLIAALQPPGASLLAGIAVLALMILPTVALSADAAFEAVPRDLLLAAEALGLPRRAIVWGVVIPVCRRALLTGVLLATGRAVGETMAVLMVCGNIVQVPASVFDPIRTLTANIALESAYAMGDHRSALFVCGLVLTVPVIVVMSAAEFTGRRPPRHAI